MKNTLLTLIFLCATVSCSAQPPESWKCGDWDLIVDYENQTMLVTNENIAFAEKTVLTDSWASISIQHVMERKSTIAFNLKTYEMIWGGTKFSCSKATPNDLER